MSEKMKALASNELQPEMSFWCETSTIQALIRIEEVILGGILEGDLKFRWILELGARKNGGEEWERGVGSERKRGAVFFVKMQAWNVYLYPHPFTLSPLNFQMYFKHTQCILPLSHWPILVKIQILTLTQHYSGKFMKNYGSLHSTLLREILSSKFESTMQSQTTTCSCMICNMCFKSKFI